MTTAVCVCVSDSVCVCQVDDPGIKRALMDGFPGVLENPDQQGRKILILFASNWDQSR